MKVRFAIKCKRSILLSLFLISWPVWASAQNHPRNIFYAEGLGLAGYHSVNYERFQPLTHDHSLLVGADAGFGLLRYQNAK